MSLLMIIPVAIVFLMTVSELHYLLARWMEQSSEVFEIEY